MRNYPRVLIALALICAASFGLSAQEKSPEPAKSPATATPLDAQVGAYALSARLLRQAADLSEVAASFEAQGQPELAARAAERAQVVAALAQADLGQADLGQAAISGGRTGMTLEGVSARRLERDRLYVAAGMKRAGVLLERANFMAKSGQSSYSNVRAAFDQAASAYSSVESRLSASDRDDARLLKALAERQAAVKAGKKAAQEGR